MKIFGLIGEKLGHSLSPDIHNKIFEDNNIDGLYNLFSVKEEYKDTIVKSIKTLGITGCNVTIPYKEVVMKQLDFVSKEAETIGSVNTILIREGKSYGYNTDYYGFGKMLERAEVNIEGNSFFVLGAGGAARSILKYLEDNKASKIVLVSRDKDKAIKKFKGFKLQVINYEELEEIKGEFALVNTTPCGMYPNIDSVSVSEEIIKNFKVAVDIVYNPLETKFLKLAKKHELKTVDGLFMLVGQGVKAEEIWNGISVNRVTEEKIYETLKNKFENK
ncbi:shikimate dehydrogenase [Clostridium perfringens]|nr:shikimate dehydrogenase [Clostridium perfringens]